MLDRRIHRRRPIRSKRSPPPLTNNRRAALLAPLIVVVVEATQNDADGSHRWSQLRPSSSSSFFSFPTASHRQQQQLDNRKIRKLFTFLPHAIKMAPDVDKFPFKKWKKQNKNKKNVSLRKCFRHWKTTLKHSRTHCRTEKDTRHTTERCNTTRSGLVSWLVEVEWMSRVLILSDRPKVLKKKHTAHAIHTHTTHR